MKILHIVLIGFSILSFVSMVPAASGKGQEFNAGNNIDEILNSINDIIKNNIKLTEAKLLELRRAFKEKGSSTHQKAKDAIEGKLGEMPADLKNMEEVIKKELEEKESLSKETLDQYSKKLDQFEEKIEELNRKAKRFGEDIEKEYGLLKDSIKQSVKDIITEMERIINRMEEGLERQKQIDQTLSI